MRMALSALVVLMIVMLAWYWPAAAEPPGNLEVESLIIETGREAHRLEVEMARTTAQRQFGLMDRDHLDPEAGMLFVYDRLQPAGSGFWMYRTRIPLDIAFIDSQGRIAAVHTMQPCRSDNPADCPATLAGASYLAALEVNAGYFTERGIGVGDCVDWPGRPAGCVTTRSVE
ncbi:DUF192 domain-containing protein [Billgrantia endophytica]|uniref:DUF192 domain-containing protein n=1 Tax=Billgrantia endophytica TaxID=2033802 RepID=A0A2N7TZ09_9GAMM|nr:DUF192 domain-containing protein [Halomonas endophytica]PMR73401.1 hypothetical protein C1H69_18260 [Halomonas endophytica]